MNKYEKIISESLKRSIDEYKPDMRNLIIDNVQPIVKNNRLCIPRPILRLLYTVTAIYIVFFLTVNIVPSAAYSLIQVPVINKLVWSSVIDKGIFSALDKGYKQTIDKTVQDNGVTFTIHDIIIGNKIHFLMSLKFSSDIEQGEFDIVNDASDQNGKALNFTKSNKTLYDKENDVYIYSCDVFSFLDDMTQDISNIDLKISSIKYDNGIELNGNWQISIPIQLDKSTKEAIWRKEFNTTLTKDGITFILDKVISTPSDVVVWVKVNVKDSKNIRSIYIIDSKGNRTTMTNAFGKKNGDMMEIKFYYDAIYPNIPEKIGYNDGGNVKEFELK